MREAACEACRFFVSDEGQHRLRPPFTNVAFHDQAPPTVDPAFRDTHAQMARSAHAYVRGSTVKFYEWLGASGGNIPEGPPTWICGDCHLGNLGPLADAKGRVAIQIRDLDQTVIGNPAHDLIRLGLSLASAARGSDLPGVTPARILEQLIAGYEAALAGTSIVPQIGRISPLAFRGFLSVRCGVAGITWRLSG